MHRSLKALLAALFAGAVILPGVASAKEVKVGVTASPVIAPTCPTGTSGNSCSIVLTEVTALESKRDGVVFPTTIKTNGVISAFSVGVSAISSSAATVKKDVSYLDNTYGGAPAVQLTVLRPYGKAASHGWRVAAKSPVFPIRSYLGHVVELPLIDSIPVVKGEVLALTVPTWAPVLSIDLTASKFGYEQSRSANCSKFVASKANVQSIVGEFATYGCNYTSTRVEYSALEITSP